jgi:hypothetical protein
MKSRLCAVLAPSLVCVTLVCATFAHAAEMKIVSANQDPKSVRAELVAAAEQVCRAARTHDYFGDFGTQEECVQDTLDNLRHAAPRQDAFRVSAAR